MKSKLAVMVMLIPLLVLAGCEGKKQTSSTAVSNTDSVQAEGMLWSVKPLEKKTKLVVSYLSNSTAELVTYLANEKGWFDACNLEVELVYFAGGPAQMEASNSWDVGTTGIGGMITGTLNYDIRCLGVVSLDRGLFQGFFANKDSPIVKAGTGHSSAEGVYGTAETWKGASVLTAKGTANQYTLYNTLKSFGLNLSDVKIINMDIATIPTAFLAGQGDAAGIQGMAIHDEVFQRSDSKYVMVSSDQLLKCGLAVNYVSTEAAWKKNQQAVELWLELAVMAGQYANAHQDEAAAMMVDMYGLDGYETTVKANLTMISENPYIPLSENFQYFTEKNEDGTMLQAEAQIYNAMTGYVEMGNYSKEQLDKLVAKKNFYPGSIVTIMDRVSGK